MKSWVLLLTVCLVSSLVLMAGAPETTITVNVKDKNEKPVENAAVILDFLGSHQIMKLGKRKAVHWEVHTNQKGIAHFPPVPQGTVQVQVIAHDYQTFGNHFDIDTAAKAIDVTLSRPKHQYSAITDQ